MLGNSYFYHGKEITETAIKPESALFTKAADCKQKPENFSTLYNTQKYKGVC
jgi:hypothetical protein